MVKLSRVKSVYCEADETVLSSVDLAKIVLGFWTLPSFKLEEVNFAKGVDNPFLSLLSLIDSIEAG